jgi:arylsulfatase A-like enzyme
VLSDTEITFPEVLRNAGYSTFAYQANNLVSAAKGFAQGFDHYALYLLERGRIDGESSLFHKRASTLDRDALMRMWMYANRAKQEPAKPFLLYMQYMEPHVPWRPTGKTVAQDVPADQQLSVSRLNSAFFLANVYPPTEKVWSQIGSVYDAVVRDLDDELRDFFAELDALGVLENTYVIITSDHGEELGEHDGLASHGISLFNEETHVPFIVVPPWEKRRTDIQDVVSLIDLAPTIVALAGLPVPSVFAGRTFDDRFIRYWSPFRTSRDTGAYSSLAAVHMTEEEEGKHSNLHRSAYVRESKKIVETETGALRLYRLDRDPGENDPLILGPENRVLEEAFHLAEAVARVDVASPESSPISEAMRERLKALGYLE